MTEYRRGTVEERFRSKIVVDLATGCHRWTGAIDPAGYGRFTVSKDDRSAYAHRVGFELFVGPIPEGKTLDHTCHTNDALCAGGPSCLHRRCVNTNHLEPVTHEENKQRGSRLIRALRAKLAQERVAA